jgi:hypothetical protein
VSRRPYQLAASLVATLVVVPSAAGDHNGVTATFDPPVPHHNGWYNAPVDVVFGAPLGYTCEPPDDSYSGPDDGDAKFSTLCTHFTGLPDLDLDHEFPFKYDATPPVTRITQGPPTLSRNAAAQFRFTAADTASTTFDFECELDGGGFSACAVPHTVGPLADGGHTFGVRAIDEAGHVDPTPAVFRWRIDSTPPAKVSGLRAKVTDPIGAWSVKLTWRNPKADVATIFVRRRPGRIVNRRLGETFVDRNLARGVSYLYTIVTRDRAGNQAGRSIRVSELLRAPRDGAVRTRRPRLFDWRSLANTRYYHFQLWRLNRRGALVRRITLRWPAWSQVTITRGLADGRYGWWVWRGVGARAEGRFQLIGRSMFTKR